jgi:hypothetical protein
MSSNSEKSHEYYINDDIEDERANLREADKNNMKKCKGVNLEFSNSMRQ